MPMPAPRAAILFLTFFPRRFLLPCLLSPSGVPRAPEAGDIFPTAGSLQLLVLSFDERQQH